MCLFTEFCGKKERKKISISNSMTIVSTLNLKAQFLPFTNLEKTRKYTIRAYSLTLTLKVEDKENQSRVSDWSRIPEGKRLQI